MAASWIVAQVRRGHRTTGGPAGASSHHTGTTEAPAAEEAGGHGHFDLAAYDSYLSGALQDYEHPQSEIEAALAGLPSVAE